MFAGREQEGNVLGALAHYGHIHKRLVMSSATPTSCHGVPSEYGGQEMQQRRIEDIFDRGVGVWE